MICARLKGRATRPCVLKNARAERPASGNLHHYALESRSRQLAATDVPNAATVGVSQILRFEFH
jgi:hypothetical protein